MQTDLTITWGTILSFIVFLVSVIGWIWTLASLVAKLKAKPNLKDIKVLLDTELEHYVEHKAVQEMIDDKIQGHCPNMGRIAELEKYKVEHTEWGQKENDKRKEAMHIITENIIEIGMNLKRLCEHNKLPYIKKNGN